MMQNLNDYVRNSCVSYSSPIRRARARLTAVPCHQRCRTPSGAARFVAALQTWLR